MYNVHCTTALVAGHRIIDARIEKSIKGRRIGHWAFAAIFKVKD